MRRFSIKYAFSEAFQGLWRNGVMTFASIAVLMSCLVVIGAFSLLVGNINENLNALGDLTKIVAFVDREYDEAQIKELESKIGAINNVTKVEHVTKEQALEDLRAQAKEKGEAYDYITAENNPLPDEFIISYDDVSSEVDIKYALDHMEGITKVNDHLELASTLESFRSGVLFVFMWFLIVLIVVSVFIIVNTIKLAVDARRNEITVMRYVGATGMFITMPFLIEGVIIGISASVIGYFIEWWAYKYIENEVAAQLSMISFVSFGEVWYLVLFGFIALGILAGTVGSMLSLHKYMKV
jgi:cell division transport system permease protein